MRQSKSGKMYNIQLLEPLVYFVERIDEISFEQEEGAHAQLIIANMHASQILVLRVFLLNLQPRVDMLHVSHKVGCIPVKYEQ